jgi:hypothetical protein
MDLDHGHINVQTETVTAANEGRGDVMDLELQEWLVLPEKKNMKTQNCEWIPVWAHYMCITDMD